MPSSSPFFRRLEADPIPQKQLGSPSSGLPQKVFNDFWPCTDTRRDIKTDLSCGTDLAVETWIESSSILHCVSKNDTGVAHYNFNAHQPILVIFDRDVAERVCYQKVICYPTSPN